MQTMTDLAHQIVDLVGPDDKCHRFLSDLSAAICRTEPAAVIIVEPCGRGTEAWVRGAVACLCRLGVDWALGKGAWY